MEETYCKRNHIDERVDLESAYKKKVKMFEHFREEVPKQPNVWLQITYIQSETRKQIPSNYTYTRFPCP
jgi:hypothetical protein